MASRLSKKLADMTPEQLTEIPGIGEKMVEKIQASVAAYFQSLENAQPEMESLETLAAQENAGETVEQTEAVEQAAEDVDVAAEEIEAPAEENTAASGDSDIRNSESSNLPGAVETSEKSNKE